MTCGSHSDSAKVTGIYLMLFLVLLFRSELFKQTAIMESSSLASMLLYLVFTLSYKSCFLFDTDVESDALDKECIEGLQSLLEV